MTRTIGAKDADYDTRRAALLDKIIVRISQTNLTRPSMRQLAKDIDVTVPTLLHYFGDRNAVIIAAFEHWHNKGRDYLEAAKTPNGTLAQSVHNYVETLVIGLTNFGLADILAAGFVETLLDEHKGPDFVEHALEPIINVCAARLQAHQDRGDMDVCDVRFAALALISPILIACHHQFQLSGARDYPLKMEAFLDEHVARFVRAYGA